MSPDSNNTDTSATAGFQDFFTSCPAGAVDVQTFNAADALADSVFSVVLN